MNHIEAACEIAIAASKLTGLIEALPPSRALAIECLETIRADVRAGKIAPCKIPILIHMDAQICYLSHERMDGHQLDVFAFDWSRETEKEKA